MKKRVLFICTHNSARSQMAEGIANALFGDKVQALSAGTEPTIVHPMAVEVMMEIGIDISGQRSKSVNEYVGVDFDIVVTVCDKAHEACPFFPGTKRYVHRSFEDPASSEAVLPEQLKKAFRTVRDEIKVWIGQELLSLLNEKEVRPEPPRF